MEEKLLIKDNIVNILIKGERYFLVSALKKKYGEIKTESVIKVDNKKYVLAKNVEKYTEFDKSIKKVLSFKDKK